MPRRSRRLVDMRVRTEHLVISLARPDVKDPRALLRDASAATEITIAFGVVGLLAVPRSARRRPSWVSFFDGTEGAAAVGQVGAMSAGAALVLRARGRCFALTWGHSGRSLVHAERLVDRFGLKTTLSAIPADRVRSIEHRSFDALTRNTVSQGSRDGEVYQYGIDVERDLMRAVLGVPTDPTLGKRLHGKDALAATVVVALSDLPEMLGRYLDVYESDAYRQEFKWIDHLAEENNKAVIERLEGALIKQLRAGELERLRLAPPEVLPWEHVGHFSYAGDRDRGRHDELDIGGWYATLRAPDELDAKGLRSRHVRWHDATSGEIGQQWTIHRALHAEIKDRKHTYLLSEGKWFRVTTSFVEEIDQTIAKLVEPTTLPPYRRTAAHGPPHAGERDYNAEVAANDPRRFALLDAKNIMVGGGPSRLEACDLFGADGVMTHVKRYNASKDMSHLFAQGANAAQALLNLTTFRRDVAAKLPASHRRLIPSRGALSPAAFRVRYAIIREPSATGASVTERLPFFSRLALRRAARALENLGVKVSVMHVDAV